MEKPNFWAETLRHGALLGVLLALSSLLEYKMQLSGSVTTYTFFVFEWVAVIVAHYYLLHRFTRARAGLYSAEEGFSFSTGYSYLLALSAVAGFFVGLAQVVYLHLFLGYTNYVERLCDSILSVLTQGGNVPASMETLIYQTIEQLRVAPEPSLLATMWGGLFTCLLFGGFFGLIIAGVLTRAPRPFENMDSNQ